MGCIRMVLEIQDTGTFGERKDYTIQMCKILNVKNEVIEKLEGK